VTLVKIDFERDGDHVVYTGPCGPLRFRADQDPATAVIVTPEGEDGMEFGMARTDLDALRSGVAVRIAGEDFRLRRDGKSLHLLDAAGRSRVIARRAMFGKTKLERPDGTVVATFLGLDGKVDERAEALEVRLLLLLAVSGATRAIERRASGDLLPIPGV